MRTKIETPTLIAEYEDNRQMRDEMFEYIVGIFSENKFSSYEIIKNSLSEDIVCKLENYFNFKIKYKD